MRIKITKEDKAFSLLIRYRANWICECCGRRFQPGDGGLQCSHFMGRRHKGTRYDPDNAAAHCFTCHRYFTENPIHFAEWIKKRLGETGYQNLMRKAHSVTKFTAADIAFLYAEMQDKVKVLKARYEQAA